MVCCFYSSKKGGKKTKEEIARRTQTEAALARIVQKSPAEERSSESEYEEETEYMRITRSRKGNNM